MISRGDEPGPSRSHWASSSILVIGASQGEVCGVRDHAWHVTVSLRTRGVDVKESWWERSVHGSLVVQLRDAHNWLTRVSRVLSQREVSAVVVHYSVFALSHRGIPVFPWMMWNALRKSRLPVIIFLHELAYPWGRHGWRGCLWAMTQRLVLVPVVMGSSSLIVTTKERALWIGSRRWLKRRPVTIAPVFSNLPPSGKDKRSHFLRPVVGLFGYGGEGVYRDCILDSVVALHARGVDARLRLLGAPGRDSPAGRSWVSAARARAIEDAVEFTGALPAQELSDALAGCELLLFADADGPTSRKGTLAASLASGRPVVALDGPSAWAELLGCGAVRVVPPDSVSLARCVDGLLTDAGAAEALGARGQSFANEYMSVEYTTRVLSGALRAVGVAA